LGPKFFTCHYKVVLGWVSQLIGWVGSGHIKWTHGQLCVASQYKYKYQGNLLKYSPSTITEYLYLALLMTSVLVRIPSPPPTMRQR